MLSFRTKSCAEWIGMVGIISGENWIGGLPQDVREAILERMVGQDVQAGTIVRNAGDPPTAMYQVERGYLRLLGLHNDGQPMLILIFKAGNNFSESTLVAHRAANHTTVALTDARILRLSRDDFWDLYHRHSEIPEALCRKFANNISRQFIARETRRTHRLRKLVTLLFENLAEHCGRDEPDGSVTISIPFTQTDIAEHYDVTRQGVQREVGALKAEGVVSKQQNVWRIPNLERLRRV
jgi:CRP/FNR family transcriptional regulator, cyclic AMP receptor protein